MVRIITNYPPEPLQWAKRLEILRRALAWVTGLGAGATILAAFTIRGGDGFPILLTTTVGLGLLYVAAYALTILYAHRARVALFHKYGVAPNRDGVFEMVRSVAPHEDLAATREMLRVHPGGTQPPAN